MGRIVIWPNGPLHPKGRDLSHQASRQVLGQVHEMTHLSDDAPSPLLWVDNPAPRCDAAGVDPNDQRQRTRFPTKPLPGRFRKGGVAPVEAHHQDAIGLAGSFYHGTKLVLIDGEGFFHENVFSSLQRPAYEVSVIPVTGRNDHGLRVGVMEKLVHIGRTKAKTVPLRYMASSQA